MKYNYGLKLPKAETMIKECERLGLETYNLKPIELFFQLAGSESKLQCLSGVYAFKRNIDPEKLAQIKDKHMNYTMIIKKIRYIFFLFLLSGYTRAQIEDHTIEITNGEFLYDEKPIQIYSGEMHYPRVPKDY